MKRISIELAQYGEHGWEWCITVRAAGTVIAVEQGRTNAQGEGQWVPRYAGTDEHGAVYQWGQVLGTGQYSLPRDRAATYARLRRETEARYPSRDDNWNLELVRKNAPRAFDVI